MNLELILWFASWFVISEIFFVVWYRIVCKREESHIGQFEEGDWIWVKIFSLAICAALVGIHYMAVVLPPTLEGSAIGYIFFQYEAIFLGTLALIFFINKQIAKRIEK